MIIFSLIAYIVFMLGFNIVGMKMKNNMLMVTSCLFIVIELFDSSTLLLGMIFPYSEELFSGLTLAIFMLVIYGILGIFHGLSLIKLENRLGKIARNTGVLEIIISVMFLTVIFGPIAVLLIIPLYILEIILLFKAAKKFA